MAEKISAKETEYFNSPEPHEGNKLRENNGTGNYSPAVLKMKEQSTEDFKVHITDLPAEIFQHILRNLTFDNIAKLRLVSI